MDKQSAAEKTDVLGILSIIACVTLFTPLGLVLGLVGAHQAKKAHRSPVLSRIGWISSLSLASFSIAWVVSVLFTGTYRAG